MRSRLLLALILAACTQAGAPSPLPAPVSTPPITATPSATATATPRPARQLPPAEAERAVAARAKETVAALRDRDGARLSAIAHPDRGLRVSAYAFVKPRDITLSSTQLRDAFGDQTKRQWGVYDGRGDPIVLTFADYYRRFIYDADFASAPQVAYNATLGSGNTPDNTAEAYPDAVLVEYHFPGRDPMAGGLDWRSLRLLFERKGPEWYLVAVVHAEWTI